MSSLNYQNLLLVFQGFALKGFKIIIFDFQHGLNSGFNNPYKR